MYIVRSPLEKGFVKPEHDVGTPAEDEPLPSIDLLSLQDQVSHDEVALAFHLPLSTIADSSRLTKSLFRGDRPYTVIDVTDVIRACGTSGAAIPITSKSSEEDTTNILYNTRTGQSGSIEVWGLTGWYVSLLMRILGIHGRE